MAVGRGDWVNGVERRSFPAEFNQCQVCCGQSCLSLSSESYTDTLTVCIYPTPPHKQYATPGQFFMRTLTGLKSGFSFSETSCHSKVKELVCSAFLYPGGERIVGFIPL